MPTTAEATKESQRIIVLDVIRGFALLGILLVNIIGFGMLSAAYLNPQLGIQGTWDFAVWALVDVFAEGAMRCLFAMLFGAGIMLFATGENAKSFTLFWRRNMLLLLFGLINLYLLIWPGDILTTYAIAGLLLYFVRRRSARFMLVSAGLLIVIMSLAYSAMNLGLQFAEQAAADLASADGGASSNAELQEAAAAWEEFAAPLQLDEQAIADELAVRRGPYAGLFVANLEDAREFLLFVLPFFTLWDALATMLLGMAFYQLGIFHAKYSRVFYARMAALGFVIGLAVNSAEVANIVHKDFHILAAFPFLLPSYHLGRVAMGIAYLGALIWLIQGGYLHKFFQRLASVGRMALTNYLMQSVFGLVIFSGLGFAMVGTLSRAQLYWVVFAIWLFQLWFSGWWLARYRFGPVEYLWRAMTYGQIPANRRQSSNQQL